MRACVVCAVCECEWCIYTYIRTYVRTYVYIHIHTYTRRSKNGIVINEGDFDI